MKEILTILILIGATHHVEDGEKGVTMINFTGHAKSDYFEGEVLSGGVDTQTHWTRDSTTLSARYMLQGKDSDGKECFVFVQNEGGFFPSSDGSTRPQIVTNSEVLKKFCREPLTGKLDFAQEGLTIRIYGKE